MPQRVLAFGAGRRHVTFQREGHGPPGRDGERRQQGDRVVAAQGPQQRCMVSSARASTCSVSGVAGPMVEAIGPSVIRLTLEVAKRSVTGWSGPSIWRARRKASSLTTLA